MHAQNDLEAWKMSPNYNYDVPKQGFVRIAALRLVCKKKKKKSVTLSLKSLNDYKHFILRTTLNKDLQNFQWTSCLNSWSQTEKSHNLLTNRIWWLGLCATLSWSYKILICRQLTFAFRDGLIPCSFFARYYFWPKQLITNIASKLNGRSRTVILSDDWTICERFRILTVAFGRERERKCSIYLFWKII